MKVIFRVIREAKQYAHLLIIAAISTLLLTTINLIAPRLMSTMTKMVADGMTEDKLSQIWQIAVTLLFLYLCKILFRFLSNFLAHKAAWNLVEQLRMKVYRKLQALSMDYYRSHESGDLVSRTMNDVASFELLYAHLLPESITNILTVIGVTAILISINVRLALLTCLPIPFILFSGWFFAKKVRPNFRKMQKYQGMLSAQLQDNFSGMQEIQSFGQQKRAASRVQEKASNFTKTMLHALKLSAVFHPTVEFLTGLGTVIVVGYGGFLALHGQLDVSDIVAFLLYLALFYAPITGLAQLLESLQQAMAGAERVIEILDAPEQIQNRPDATPIEKALGELDIEHVSFSYREDAGVLDDISFHINPGEMIALVGPTGVGKSTVVQLISRFYDPTVGRILLDGRDLRDIELTSLRKNIAMVLQDTFLFNGSISENIGFARAGASHADIEEAARIARIHDDILSMPDGYDTHVGERGARLSGGQRQRIAIARAVLCQAPILILDEATASVDVQTEASIQNAIQDLAGAKTIIAIAHRLSTVRKADCIIVLENGKIIQKGTHDELSNVPGVYQNMCGVQENLKQ